MKQAVFCRIWQPLGLFNATRNSIIWPREQAAPHERCVQFEAIPNHPLEHGSFLLANRRDARRGTASADRALPRLLAARFRPPLPPGTLSNRCAGFNAGLLYHAA